MNQMPDVSLLQLYLRITSKLEEFDIPKYKTPTRKDKVKFLLALMTDTLKSGNFKLITLVKNTRTPIIKVIGKSSLLQVHLYHVCDWEKSRLGLNTYSQLANSSVILFP